MMMRIMMMMRILMMMRIMEAEMMCLNMKAKCFGIMNNVLNFIRTINLLIMI